MGVTVMILEPIKPRILAVRSIPNVDLRLSASLKLEPRHRSIGMITCTIDDALYAALDEGTKAAEVDVVYARSFYAGSAHASGPFSGEIIGILAAEDPEIVSSGLQATLRYLEQKAWFYAATSDNALGFFPHVIPRVGRYLARQAGVEPGTPMAYLIAPPIEALLGLDAALKAAEVELKVFYAPPSETNFAGGLLVGEQPAVEAAALAFQETILDLACRPHAIEPAPEVETLSTVFGRVWRARGPQAGARYSLHESGFGVDRKPDGYTHLFDDTSLVPKTHAAIRFRGRLDLLQAQVIDAAVTCRAEGLGELASDLKDILDYLRKMLAAEVTGRPMPELRIAGFSGEELHRISHHTLRLMNVGWVLPEPSMGAAVARLNLLRASSREVEMAAWECYADPGHLDPEQRDRMLHGLNRLSNAIYVLVCKAVAKRAQRPAP
jgi:ethanolamine utilization protein EutL